MTRIDFQDTESKVKVKVLVCEKMPAQYLETTLLESCYTACRQNITPIDVQVTWLKVTVVKLLIFKKNVVRSTFAGKLPF